MVKQTAKESRQASLINIQKKVTKAYELLDEACRLGCINANVSISLHQRIIAARGEAFFASSDLKDLVIKNL